MMRKFFGILPFLFVNLILLAPWVEAETVVTIAVKAGPAFTEANVETVDLILPARHTEDVSLQIGDKVFFEAFEAPLMGEGIIINIYEMQADPLTETTDGGKGAAMPKKAIFIAPVLEE